MASPQLQIFQATGITPDERELEIVERKGLGHPDTICDSVMEEVSLALTRVYLARFGAVLHHNTDKGLLVGGNAEYEFGGGRIVSPMRLFIGDRATNAAGSERIDVASIAHEAAIAWIRRSLPHVDPDRHVDVHIELRPGSAPLRGIFRESGAVLGANDTSAAVGYAPLTETEKVVLETERYLNSTAFKDRYSGTGQDVKVMGARTGRLLDLTIAMPLLAGEVHSEAAYFEKKHAIADDISRHVSPLLRTIDHAEVSLNALDRRGAGVEGVYLSVVGTSAEHADSGQVGRGNQVNGLIALHRPRGAEAAAGKNPVSHVGKIYSVLSHLLARAIHSRAGGVRAVTVWLQSRIGEPVDRPAHVGIELSLDRGVDLRDIQGLARETVEEELARMPEFCRELAEGRYAVC